MAGISEEEFLGLTIDADPEMAAQIQAIFNEITEGAQRVNSALDNMASGSEAAIDKTTTSVNELSTQLTSATEQANQLADAMKQSGGYDINAYDINARAIGYGAKGGMIGPAEDTGEGGGTGSLFSLGHGLSVAGHALGAPGLSEAGGFVYIEEGVRKTLPMLEDFATKITGLADPTIAMTGLLVPAALALGAIAIAFSAFNNMLEASRNALSEAISGLDSYYKAIQTGTTESINKQIEALKEKNQADQAELAQLQKAKADAFQSTANQPGGLQLLGLAQITGQFKEMDDRIAALKKSTGEATQEIDALGRALDSDAVAANNFKAAQEQFGKEQVDRVQRETDLKKQEYSDSQMTSEAAKKRLDMLQQERESTAHQMAELEPFIKTSDAAAQKYSELYFRQENEKSEISDLTTNIIPLIQAREAEAAAIKQTQKDLDTASKAITDFGKGKADAETALANQIETAHLRETQAEAKARQDTADRITDIRTNLGEKEVQLATGYQRSIFDDRVKFFDDWNKLSLKANNDAQENQIQHLQKLQDIQNRASIEDQQALLDRNFLQLAKNQLGRSTQASQEDQHYAEAQQALARHLQFEQVQLANNLRVQEEQDLRNYQRKLADAETVANNEIAQQHTLEARKLQAIQQGLDNEIVLYRLAENQKIAIMQQAMNQIVSAASADLARIAHQSVQNTLNQSPLGQWVGGIAHGLGLFAEGGTFGPSQPFVMSEAGPETLRIGGQGYNVGGAAMVYPLQGGSVEKGGSSTHSTYAPVNNFYEAHDMAATQRMVEQVQQRQLKEFFGA